MYNWSQEQQGIILSSFFFGYLITQIPGGILSQRYGGKYVFMLGILFSALCSLLTPNVTRFGKNTLTHIQNLISSVDRDCEAQLLIVVFIIHFTTWSISRSWFGWPYCFACIRWSWSRNNVCWTDRTIGCMGAIERAYNTCIFSVRWINGKSTFGVHFLNSDQIHTWPNGVIHNNTSIYL